MEIAKQKEGTTLNVTLVGRLDTNTSPELDAVLKAELPGVTDLTIDLANSNTFPPPDCACFSRRRRP